MRITTNYLVITNAKIYIFSGNEKSTKVEVKEDIYLAKIKALSVSQTSGSLDFLIHMKNTKEMFKKDPNSCVDKFYRLTSFQHDPYEMKQNFIDSLKHAYFGVNMKNLKIIYQKAGIPL